VKKHEVQDLCSLRFLEDKQNILFIGSSGVGKTHLATAIGMEASSKRISTYFIHFNDLISKIKKAHSENRHEYIISITQNTNFSLSMRLDIFLSKRNTRISSFS